MSNTKIDFPKVTQMLDAAWVVTLFKNDLGSYTAMAQNEEGTISETDDFTPQQALTRLAYKIHGEVIE